MLSPANAAENRVLMSNKPGTPERAPFDGKFGALPFPFVVPACAPVGKQPFQNDDIAFFDAGIHQNTFSSVKSHFVTCWHRGQSKHQQSSDSYSDTIHLVRLFSQTTKGNDNEYPTFFGLDCFGSCDHLCSASADDLFQRQRQFEIGRIRLRLPLSNRDNV